MERDEEKFSSELGRGNIIPGYKVLSVIGRGSMGVVYKALQESMERLVALKVLPERFASDEEFAERFIQEARSVARLRHENIVSALDAGEYEGTYYFVMEFVEGRNLADILAEEGSLPAQEAARIVAQIGEALQHAHSAGLVHRDVKPGNILLSESGVAKLCDLGLTRPAGDFCEGRAEGTPYYISPEQAKGGQEVDRRADIYSLGATFYHLLTGKPPFTGANAKEIVKKHIAQNVPPLRETCPGAPREYALIVEKMLQKESNSRYESAAQVVEDIERVLEGKEPLLGTSRPEERLPQRISLFVSRHRAVVTVLGGLATAFVVLLILYLSGLVYIKGLEDKKPRRGEERLAEEVKTQRAIEEEEKPKPRVEMPAPVEHPVQALPLVADLEKEARERLSGEVQFAKENPDKLDEAIARFEAVLKRYSGTVAARKARTDLTALLEEKSRRETRGFEQTRFLAEGLLEASRYAAAVRLWTDFVENQPDPALKKRAQEEIKALEQSNAEALEHLKEVVNDLLSQGEFGKALEAVEKLREESLENLLGEVDQIRETVEARQKDKVESERFKQALTQFDALMSEGKYSEAALLCETFLKSGSSTNIAEEMRWRKDFAACAAEARRRITSGLTKMVDKKITMRLIDETEISGKLVSAGEESVSVKVPRGVDPLILKLTELDAVDLLRFASVGSQRPALQMENACFLLARGCASAAEKEFEEAQKGGVSIEKKMLDYISQAKLTERERTAQGAIQRAISLCGAKKWKEAAEKFAGIFSDGGIIKTAYFKQNEKSLRKSYRMSLIELEVSKGASSVLKGKVKERGDYLTIIYDFSKEEQGQDWQKDGKCSDSAFSVKSGKMETKGKINLKAQFTGDVSVEAACASSQDRPPNIGVLINDTGDHFYLMGLGFQVGTNRQIGIDAARGRAQQQIALPASLILRYGNDLNNASALFGGYLPRVSGNAVYKVRALHKGGVLELSADDESIGSVNEDNQDDEKGRIGFFSYNVTLWITGVAITGKVEEKWLRDEIEKKIDKQYSFTEEDKQTQKKQKEE